MSLFFLFYSNRLFATIVSYAIRLYSWHAYRVYIDIGALQLSLLGGRIFFKDIIYHGDNETITIHAGYVTWRYWLRTVKTCRAFEEGESKVIEDSNYHGNRGGPPIDNAAPNKTKELPCRISVNVSGVEAFLYNRSPSYDFILENLKKQQATTLDAKSPSRDTSQSEKAGTVPSAAYAPPGAAKPEFASEKIEGPNLDHYETTGSSSISSPSGPVDAPRSSASTPPAFLRMLPIHVEANTVAAVLGNQNTKSIITAKVTSAKGEFDAETAGQLDLFKILIDFDIEHPVIRMLPNMDYKQPQLEEAALVKTEPRANRERKRSRARQLLGKTTSRRLSALVSRFQRSYESIALHSDGQNNKTGQIGQGLDVPGNGRWQGLSRYLDDSRDDEHGEWDPVEYAKTSTLVDLVSVHFRFYWDIPGRVPWTTTDPVPALNKGDCSINGGVPPEYGMEIRVRGGHVNYGPWADRHRLALQQAFFPASYANATPTVRLRAGQDRLCTIFDIFVSIEEDTVLRIPFREPSKDWRWKGRSTAYNPERRASVNAKQDKTKYRKKGSKQQQRDKGIAGADLRPFAWFDIVIKANSSIAYVMDMFPRAGGFQNDLRVDVSGLEIFSSLNHALLWRSHRVTLNCDLSYPLTWRGLRTWVFDVDIVGLEFFLLRDHTFLLVDLIEDWTTGPRPEFYTFVPFRYLLNTKFHDFKLFLNVNDGNIINYSDDIEENDFVILFGATLDSQLVIPLDRLNPPQSDIIFDVTAKDLGFELRMPPKNTLNELLTDKTVASLPSVTVNGVYNMRTEPTASTADTLNLNIVGDGLKIQFFGFFARQLVKLKENYFGDDIHFRTFEEYQTAHERDDNKAGDGPPSSNTNDLDVILNIVAHDGVIMLPSGLYDSRENVFLNIHTVDVDLRVNNYYLELMVNSYPLEMGCNYRHGQAYSETTQINRQLSIDGVAVYGHRLFGLAPSEPAYVSSWDIDAGEIFANCSENFIAKTVAAAQSLVTTVGDVENAMPVPLLPMLHDITYVRFACPLLSLWTHTHDDTFMFKIQDINGSFQDCAGQHFSQRLHIQIPHISFACLDRSTSSEFDSRDNTLPETFAYVHTALTMTMVQRDPSFEENRQKQQDFVAIQDQRSHRAMFFSAASGIRTGISPGNETFEQPSVSLPKLPAPLQSSDFVPGQLPSLNSVSTGGYHHKQRIPEINHKSSLSMPRYSGSSQSQGTRAKVDTFRSPALGLHGIFRRPDDIIRSQVIDLSQVPELSKTSSEKLKQSEKASSDILFNPRLADDSLQTSLIFMIEPGITAYAQPRAINAIGNLIDMVLPKHPDQVFDEFSVETLGEVMSSYSKRLGKNNILDVGVHLPQLCLRFINDALKQDLDPQSDQWDMTILNADLSIRQKVLPERADEANSTSVHATVKSIHIIAQPAYKTATDDRAFETTIDDVLIWLMDGDRTSVHMSLRTISAAIESRKMEQLAHLIHQTAVLGENLQAHFHAINVRKTQRRRDLIYLLTKYGEGVGDPAFLNRPAYASRHSTEQLRNSDSWKIISRLRHILLTLSTTKRQDLCNAFFNGENLCPTDAENYVVAGLDTWRSWDAIRVRDSFAIRILFGSMGGIEKMHDRSKIPLGIHAQANVIRFIVDPGVKENSFNLDGLALGLTVDPPPLDTATKIFHEHSGCKSTVLQVNTSKAALHLNWDLVELIDRLLYVFNKTEESVDELTTPSSFEAAEKDSENFHLVFVSKIGVVAIETINLTHTFESEGLKVSATGSVSASDKSNIMEVNTLSNAKSTSIDVRSRKSLICYAKTTEPTLWVDFERKTSATAVDDSLRLAGDSKKAVFKIKEEILGLLEVANSVIAQEASSIRKLVLNHFSPAPKTNIAAHAHIERTFKPSVTLFLNVYEFEVALTQDLQYATKGNVARLAISPAKDIPSGFCADFDLKSQAHDLIILSQKQAPRLASTIQMPAINGGLNLVFAEKITTVSTTLSMEAIELEGTAMYGLLSTILNEQTSSVIDAIASDVLAVKHTFTTQFPESKARLVAKEISKDEKKPVMFDSNIFVAGCSVSANAPVKSLSSYSAKLLIFSGPVHAKLSNRPSSDGMPLPFPEFHVSMRHAGLELLETGDHHKRNLGRVNIAATFTCTNNAEEYEGSERNFCLAIQGPDVEVFPDTAPAIAEVACHIQDRIQGLDFKSDRHHFRRLRHIVPANNAKNGRESEMQELPYGGDAEVESTFTLDLEQASIRYVVHNKFEPTSPRPSDLIFSIQALNLDAKSSREAKLRIVDLQLHLAPKSQEWSRRPLNSALLPEMLFSVVNEFSRKDRKLYFRATGKALEVLLDSRVVPLLNTVENSLDRSIKQTKVALSSFQFASTSSGLPPKNIFGAKNLTALVMDITFAGAIIRLQSRERAHSGSSTVNTGSSNGLKGRYGQFSDGNGPAQATLKAPGVATKVEFIDNMRDAASLNIEIRVDGSNNTFSPSVVPVILEIAQGIKQIVRDPDDQTPKTKTEDKPAPRLIDDEALVQADPQAILGRTKLNVGFRICRQAFSLSCHPIAKVAASASIDDIYFTVNTVDTREHGHFFAGTAAIHGLKLTLKHDYNQTPTFGFNMESIMLSVMNSKHLNGTPGISAILRVKPTKINVNAKSLQDILLFREIWLPAEIRSASQPASTEDQDTTNDYFVHRYHQLAAAKTFRWNVTFAVADLSIDLDLGQAIGKVSFGITNLWASSKKSTSSQQSLCVGIDNVFVHSAGRMSGFVELRQVNARTSIAWPSNSTAFQTPMIQGSISFDQIRIKASFDYQVFAIAHITSFEFIMYNLRDEKKAVGDRLVAILDGDKVNIYCISASAALGFSLFQAFEKLVKEQEKLYIDALADVEKYLHRRSSVQVPSKIKEANAGDSKSSDLQQREPLKIHTDVVVSLQSIDIGAFPNTLFDKTLLRLTASETQTQFAVVNESGKTRSGLGLELGKVNAALSHVTSPIVPKALGDISIEEVVKAATTSSKGVILAVPRVIASMQTWQSNETRSVEYIFSSTFEGKIDVGWNYARISFIRGMWTTHSKALSSRLGKALPESALQIHGGPQPPEDPSDASGAREPSREEQKLTAVVNLPQSSYTYVALEPPIIETPQLRDMGDATPPLEWVGLHRDKLPNVTHQIIIVPLLEVAREVGDAYTRILGSA